MAYQTKQQQAVLRCLQLRAEECLSAADLSEEPQALPHRCLLLLFRELLQ